MSAVCPRRSDFPKDANEDRPICVRARAGRVSTHKKAVRDPNRQLAETSDAYVRHPSPSMGWDDIIRNEGWPAFLGP